MSSACSSPNNNGSDPTLVQHNLFEDNTNPGSASGNDIYADNFTAGGAIDGATIDANAFTNSSYVDGGIAVDLEATTAPTEFSNITLSNNTIDNHGTGVLFTGTSDSLVTGNTFTPGITSQDGVLIWDGSPYFSVSNANIAVSDNTLGCSTSCAGAGVAVQDPGAAGVTINRNDLGHLANSITSTATATVDGTCNWFGQASGPAAGQVVGAVTTAPWLKSNVLSGSCLLDSTLSYTGDVSATVGHYTTLSASLTGTLGGSPVAGKSIDFTLGSGPSAQTVSATTDPSGVATSTALVPAQDSGAVPLSVSFAGDTDYASSSANSALAVAKAATTIALTPPASGFVSASFSFRATLTTPVVTPTGTTNVPLAGKSVSFSVCPQPSGACFQLHRIDDGCERSFERDVHVQSPQGAVYRHRDLRGRQ